ncbi:MAG: sugar phosphate isomerase/epimerase [Opitutaceae bacterium]|nr:sugar phosphate isomerase/epimerase [Opitutaceae bacterium]
MKKPLSIQMWSLRDDQAKDFAATVRTVKEIGFAGVELAGYGNLDAAGAKKALDNVGLQVSGMHVMFQALTTDINSVIRDALLFQTRNVICPWIDPVLLPSAEAAANLGARLTEAGRALRAYGIQLCYHNHDAEMKVSQGKTYFEALLDAAPASVLSAEVDVYWVKYAGLNPVELLRRLGTRCALVHLKDQKELGTGPVDFPTLFTLLDQMPWLEWHVFEQENYSHAPLESVRQSFEQLRKWGRV